MNDMAGIMWIHIGFLSAVLSPLSLMFSVHLLMQQQAGDWQIHLLVMDGHLILGKQNKLPTNPASRQTILYKTQPRTPGEIKMSFFFFFLPFTAYF